MAEMSAFAFSRAVGRIVSPLNRRVRLMVGRAIIRLVDDAQGAQRVQLDMLEGEDPDSVERFGEYGLASHPPDDTDAIGLAVGGDRSHVVCIATNHRDSRPKNLAKGEVALFTQQHGKRFYARDNGKCDIGANNEDLSDDQLVAIAKLVKSEISALRDTVNALVTVFNAHTHPSGMGPTGTPASSASAPAAVGDVKCENVRVK